MSGPGDKCTHGDERGPANFREVLFELRHAIRASDSDWQRQLQDLSNTFVVDVTLKREITMLLYRASSGDFESADELRTTTEDLLEAVESGYDPEFTRTIHDRWNQFDSDARERFQQHHTVALRCVGVVKSFKRGFSLGPVDFELMRGQIAGIVGENGNGKTTLFRIVVGELANDAGTLAYPFLGEDGPRINWHRVKQNIAYVPQELPAWYGSLRENLEYEAAVHGIRGAENVDAVDFVVQRLGLGPHLDKSWKKLAGGFKFRFALARALVWKPCLMVLDEPLANLDPKAQLSVLRDLRSLAKSASHPIAIMLSSQHIDEVEAVADKMIALRSGEVSFNDYISRYGLNRTTNAYLLDVALDRAALQSLYPKELDVAVSHDGLRYILTTDLRANDSDILTPLLDRSIRVKYFQNISCSTNRIFQSSARD